jgi:hypothetical protein
MNVQPIDLPELAGVVLGCAIPLVAITGAMLRLVLKPFADALGRGRGNEVRQLEERVEALERRLEQGRLRPAGDEGADVRSLQG